jgi:RNA recognition motif-containing protein
MEGDDNLLYRLFGPFGAITQVNISRDASGKSKGYGFVHFVKYEDAHQAIISMNGAQVEKKVLQVSFKTQKTQK